MRKLIVAFAFMVIALTSYAQSGSEHLTFKGIPIEGSMTEFVTIQRIEYNQVGQQQF